MSYALAMRLSWNSLKAHGLTDLTDHDAFFDLFYDEDLRFEFMSLFRTFTKCLNVVFPAKEALDFMGDYQRSWRSMFSPASTSATNASA